MKKATLLLFFFLCIFGSILSQNGPDQMLQSSLDLAGQKLFPEAEKLAREAITADPARADLWVHMANLKAWQHATDSAKFYLKKAYALQPRLQELYDSWLNVLLWNKEYGALLETTQLALSNGYQNTWNVLLKQLEAYRGTERYQEALSLLSDPANERFHDSTTISVMRQELVVLNQHRALSFAYTLDATGSSINDIHHQIYIDYSQRFGSTIVFGRLNAARRFSQNGIQAETDIYRLFQDKSYLYFNAGYGFQTSVFPRYRAGIEYTRPFLKSFEATLGGRFLQFPNQPVWILTGQLGKYLGPWWLGLRPFYTLKDNGNALTILGTARLYTKIPGTFHEVECGYGNAPDERLLLEQSGRNLNLQAYRIRFGTNRPILKKDECRLSLTFCREEFLTGTYRSRVVAECVYKFRLP